MHKRNYTKKQLLIIILLSVGMLLAAVLLNLFFPADSQETKETVPEATVSPVATATPTITPEPVDPTDSITTFLQGPKSWKKGLTWSGEWGDAYYDGGYFGGFGCGLCCMANVYDTFTSYQCSPLDMYRRAKKVSGYEGGGAIDWGYIKVTLQDAGFTLDVWRKPSTYEKFQKKVKKSVACIAVVSSYESDCYWKKTSGHYVTILDYDEETDKIFLGDSGDPDHNRHWISLKKVYKSLKTANNWQYISITGYDDSKDNWKHTGYGGDCILPDGWN